MVERSLQVGIPSNALVSMYAKGCVPSADHESMNAFSSSPSVQKCTAPIPSSSEYSTLTRMSCCLVPSPRGSIGVLIMGIVSMESDALSVTVFPDDIDVLVPSVFESFVGQSTVMASVDGESRNDTSIDLPAGTCTPIIWRSM